MAFFIHELVWYAFIFTAYVIIVLGLCYLCGELAEWLRDRPTAAWQETLCERLHAAYVRAEREEEAEAAIVLAWVEEYAGDHETVPCDSDIQDLFERLERHRASRFAGVSTSGGSHLLEAEAFH